MSDESSAPRPRPQASGKRPYEAPAIRSEAIFETTALMCSKTPGAGGACNVRPAAS